MAFKAIKAFLNLEALSGIILCLTALSAIILANSPFNVFYQTLQHPSLLFAVNEGLMTLFFLLVGLELKREFLTGTLRETKKIIFPAVSALGGMIVPAIFYIIINKSNTAGLKGWAIPVATDIAFALGVLSLLGKRVPLELKLFLMALAIFDDVGAIIIIAIFNTQTLSSLFLCLAICIIVCLWWLNRISVLRLFPYFLLGFLLWLCLLKTGIHPTIAGVLLAFFIPLRKRVNPLQRLEQKLHTMVAYFVMPLFAFMNAGLSFVGVPFSELWDTVTIGIILGLFLGKQLGVFGFAWMMIKFRLASLPDKSSWLELYGVAVLCGIGFTMSLFLGTLTFENSFPAYLIKVRLGVLTGSLLSSVFGAILLHIAFRIKRITT